MEKQTDNRMRFEQWLFSNDVKNPMPSYILAAFDEASEFATSRKLSKIAIWDICTVPDYTFMRTAIEKNRIFKILHKNAAQIFEKSWRYYAEFLETLGKTKIKLPTKEKTTKPIVSPVIISETPITTDKSEISKDFSLDAFYRWLSEEEKMAPASCRGYSSSVRSISEYAIEYNWLTKTIYEIADEEEFREAIVTLRNTEAYIEYNEQQHNRFSAAIHKYMIFRTGSDTRPRKRTKKYLATAGYKKSEYFDNIVALLKKKYKFGFRYNSPIETLRFRQFAEIESVVLPEDDELLKTEIQNAGFIVDDKVYVIDDEISQGVIDIVNDIVNQGHRIIFYEALQEHQVEWLTEHHIVSEDVLKELLSNNSDQFYIGRNFMTLGEKLTEIEAIVSELKRIWGDGLLLDFTSMSERLPMIPLDRIKRAISCTTEFVWNSEETYALVDHVIISDTERIPLLWNSFKALVNLLDMHL